MKFRYITYIVVACSVGIFSSCENYLDTEVMDDQITIEEVFQRRKDTERFLANVYRQMRTDVGWSNTSPWTAISDELDVTYPEYSPSLINLGAMVPSDPFNNFWVGYYQGIRSATFFINHVDENPELSDALKLQYKAEARYLRAFFYFALFRQYGPVILLPNDAVIPSDATIEEMTIPRSTIGETVTYIQNELDAVLEMNVLPEKFVEQSDLEYGRITHGACRALKSRLLLYAASDFYNGEVNPYYKNFKNPDGTLLFDYDNASGINRWQAAADAAKAVIDMGYELYKVVEGGNINPYASYKDVFIEEWNSEVIYAQPDGGFWEMDRACSPRLVGSAAWNGWAPTQALVDAYFTENGLSIDEDPEYSEEGFSSAADAQKGYAVGTFNMYVNREPRFYVSIAFNNSRWLTNNQVIQFYNGGNSGFNEVTNARNFSRTGYLAKKLVSPKTDLTANKDHVRHFIFFRLAETYLNYAEALNEIDFNANKEEIFLYVNKIRERAGVPLYGDEAGQIAVSNQMQMRDLIRKERRVELAFESHRYFDCKRWLISEDTDGGEFYGMNIYAGKDEFHERTRFEIRSFQTKNYLWPIKSTEIYKNPKLVQNPGWSTVQQ